MSLVWASWWRLSSTLRMSLWEYPNLRNRSTLACCCWRSIVDADSECACFLSSAFCLTVWLGNPPRLLILVHQRLHGDGLYFGTVDRCQKEDGVNLCHCKHRKRRCGLRGVFRQIDCGLVFTDRICSGYHKPMTATQAQKLADVMLVKKAPVTHTKRGS